jgi:hypothetical protein
MLQQGSKRGNKKMFSSEGFSYTVKRQKDNKTWWWCSVRGKNNCCPTTVNQVGDTFTAGSLQTVVRYVERRWISSRIYPIASRCVFRQAIRTNNDVEGYHNDLNTQAVIGNPPFYLLCRLLHRESSLLPLQVKLVCEGKLKRYQRKQSRYIQCRIFSLWDQYAQHQISASILLRRCTLCMDQLQLPVLPNWLPIHAYTRVFHMKNQALCQYKHGSVWSKDYDSAGGKKIFCIYTMYVQYAKKPQTLTPPTPVPSLGEKAGGLWILHVKVLL